MDMWILVFSKINDFKFQIGKKSFLLSFDNPYVNIKQANFLKAKLVYKYMCIPTKIRPTAWKISLLCTYLDRRQLN